tara:strand:- start:1059 stop:1322 length:264 start_codon:yes stop_codon:yes gene_type:complete
MGIREQMQEHYDESLLFADGFDDCIIGVTDDLGTVRVIYCIEKMIDTLMEDSTTWQEAVEYLEFNTFGAYVGEQTPLYMESVKSFTI